MLSTSYAMPQLSDVITFAAMVSSGKVLRADWQASKARRDFIVEVGLAFLHSFVTPMFESYIKTVYPNLHDVSRPPPILRYRRNGIVERACRMDAATAWSLLEKSSRLHVHNLQIMLLVLNEEKEYDGLSHTRGFDWQKMELCMYYDLKMVNFKGHKQICTVADPSSHSGQDTMVGIVYCWSINQAAVGPVKILPPAVTVDPEEVPLGPTATRFEREGRLVRKKAYRQLQGLFSLQQDITDNKIEDYQVPEGRSPRSGRAGSSIVINEGANTYK